MQRLPDHVRDMLSTRNPQDRWCKAMARKLDPNVVYKLTMRQLDTQFVGIKKVCDALIDQNNDFAYQQLTKIINIIKDAVADIEAVINEHATL